MAISFIGVGAASALAGGGNLSPAIPAHTAGDLLLVWAGMDSNGPYPALSLSSGWDTTEGKLDNAAPAAVQCILGHRFAAAAGTTVTVTFDDSGGGNLVKMAQACVFRGVKAGAPHDTGHGSGGTFMGSPGPVSSSGFAPTTPQCLILTAVWRAENWFSMNSITPNDGMTWTIISAPTTTLGQDAGQAWAYAIPAGTPPAIGAKTWNITDSLSEWWGVYAAFDPFVEPPRHGFVNHQNPGLLAKADDLWQRRGRIFVPRLWTPQPLASAIPARMPA